MLKIGLIGYGSMGRTHLQNYVRLESEGVPLEVTAICDIEIKKTTHDLSRYHLYTDLGEMLTSEQLDMVDIALPTYLHAEVAEKAFDSKLHVLCEKPMAMDSAQCMRMIEAAERSQKRLMIGQCLRFWPEYEYLKQAVEDQTYGNIVSACFYRGTGLPAGPSWFKDKSKSGGCMLDLHIHDVDMIHWLFGKPQKVSSLSRNVIPGSGYDAVSSHYFYEDGKVVGAQADWTLQGDYGFEMMYRVNFEKGNMIFQKGTLKVNPAEGKSFAPELSGEKGYYNEIKYFVNALLNEQALTRAEPESTMASLKIVEAEMRSADSNGSWVEL